MKLNDSDLKLYQACRQDVVVLPLGNWSLLRFSGDDHLNFLQGQSTNDVLNLKDGQGQQTTFLNSKAKILALAYLYRCDECVYLMVPSSTREDLAIHLERFVVLEDVKIEKLNYVLVNICGPQARRFLEDMSAQKLKSKNLYEHEMLTVGEYKLPLAQHSFCGEEGFVVFLEDGSELHKKITSESLTVIPDHVSRCLSVEAGIPDYNDVAGCLLPETGLQISTVSYTKGCFVGQEIVARVKYRGNVNRALSGLIFDEDACPEDCDFTVRGQKGGKICSVVFSPYLNKYVAIAYLYKRFRAPETRLNVEVDGKSFKAKVCLLPFYQKQSLLEEAEELYHGAVDLFSASDSQSDIAAEPLLKEAISKNPKMADAYEILGVILSRHQRYDEAIELMKRLKEINPDEVMAYSNLSLFYMKKGMITEAEEEKAAATAAGFKKAAKERKERIEDEAIRKMALEETRRRMGMFEAVLEIDSEDLIANFGLGKAYVDLGEGEKALALLEKCLDVKKDYTVAYLQLGLAHLQCKNQARAIEIFKAGILCATQKGDLMPKSEMEQQLAMIWK